MGYRVFLRTRQINKLIIKKIVESENTDLLDKSFRAIQRTRIILKGLAVAIVKDEKLIFAKGYGYADVEAKISASPEQLFRIASVSKLITAVAIMKLVREWEN